VLNGACLAFGDATPFVDGENCYKYDGTLDGLAAVMGRALRGPDLPPVSWTVTPSYWEAPRRPAPVKSAATKSRAPLVSVVITNDNLGHSLPETLASVGASTWPELEVILVDDASSDPLDRKMLQGMADEAEPGIQLIRSGVKRGLAGARNLGVGAARGEYVLPLGAGDSIAPDFLRRAVTALEACADYDGVVPTAGFFTADEQPASGRFTDYVTWLGDCPSYALVANWISGATSLLRRSLFDRFRYNENLTSYEDWDLYLRLVQAGHRFLVTNQVALFYRTPPVSMVDAIRRPQHFRLLASMLETLPGPLHPGVRISSMLAYAPEAMIDPRCAIHHFVAAGPEGGEKPLRYEIADWMNAALKRVPLLHPRLREALAQAVLTPEERQLAEEIPLRYELADQVNDAFKTLTVMYPALKRAAERFRPER
jgi:hypothetical protein